MFGGMLAKLATAVAPETEALNARDLELKQKIAATIQTAARESGLAPQHSGMLLAFLLRLPMSELRDMVRTLVRVSDELREYVDD